MRLRQWSAGCAEADPGCGGATYAVLRASVREQPVVHTDDTGWRVGGEAAFLMDFVNQSLSVYQIRPQHRNEEVRELIPANFGAVMVCDRGRSYDAVEPEPVAQQKCLGDLIRNAAAVAEQKTGRARHFGQGLKAVLQRAILLSASRTELKPEDCGNRAKAVRDDLTFHLGDRTLRDPDNQRLLNGVGARHDRGHVWRFLSEVGIEPTNNRAERDLRPAVVARKVSHRSKNERGARAFEAFASIIHTIRKTNPSATVSILVKLISRPLTPT